jgi:DNA gyrase subunit A
LKRNQRLKLLLSDETGLWPSQAGGYGHRIRFDDARRTEIQAVSGEVDIEDLIPVEECVITLTHHGYIKRMSLDTYHTQKRGGRGISAMSKKEEDFVTELFICSSHDYILFFTDKGRMYRLKGMK